MRSVVYKDTRQVADVILEIMSALRDESASSLNLGFKGNFTGIH